MKPETIFAALGWLNDPDRGEKYVLMSEDGSTLVMDPALDRPWSSSNRLLAEHHAKNMRVEQGIKCFAVDIETAIASIIKHPKNQPKDVHKS